MQGLSKVLVILITIIVMSSGSVFAANTDIDITIQSKNPLHNDIFNITVDGILLSSSYEVKSHTVHVKTGVNIVHRPYDIVVEHIRDKKVKTYQFKGSKTYDIVLNFYFDGQKLTPILY